MLMSKKLLSLALIVSFLLLAASAYPAHVVHKAVNANSVKAPMKYAPLIGTDKIIGSAPYFPREPGLIATSPGEIVGYTQYEYQTNGSSGNRISLDSQGGIQVAWMNSDDYGIGMREIYYNYLDPNSHEWNWPLIGYSISYRNRDGYCQISTTSDARAVVGYHNGTNDSLFAAINTFPGASGFNYRHPLLWFPNRPCIWPYISIDRNERIHLIATDTTTADGVLAYTYSGDYGMNWSRAAIVDTLTTLSAVVTSSPVSDKVAISYTHPTSTAQWSNDMYYIQAADGISWDWANGKVNVTGYQTDDDSLYAYTDCDAVYDYNDNLHMIWTAWLISADSGLYYNQRLFHYDVSSGTINIINIFDSTWYDTQTWCDFGAWNFGICKMSIGVDPTNNALFTTYTSWNISDCAMSGFANGDIFMSYSIDGGAHWTMKGNLTDSHTDSCLAGECDSDHWSSLAEKVDGNLHVFYVNDKDAGAVVQTEGVVTDNPMMYLAYPNPVRTSALPEAPVLIYPADSVNYYFEGGGGGYFQFDWNDPVGVTHYQIQCAIEPTFSPPTLFDDSVYTYSEYINQDSLGYGTYYWRVRGIGYYGVGPWSTFFTFAIVPPPGTVIGTVYGPDGTTPLEGVTINSYDSENHLVAVNTSGLDGTWIVGLIPDTYSEILSKSGYSSTAITDIVVASYETTYVSAVMQEGSVCSYVIGDANGNGSFNGLDVTYSVAYFKGGPPPPYSCECTPGNTWYVAGDVNQSCSFNGLDVTYMVAYFKGGPAPHPCSDCPPAR